MPAFVIFIIALALIFDFLNGIHDSSNVVATMITSRAFPPRTALFVTALAEFSGPFIFGVAVAETIGNEIVAPHTISLEVLASALLGAILWNLLTWYLGLPSSSSHALIGGFIGAVGDRRRLAGYPDSAVWRKSSSPCSPHRSSVLSSDTWC